MAKLILTEEEFFSTYAVSLISINLKNAENRYKNIILNEFNKTIKKYINITNDAIVGELINFPRVPNESSEKDVDYNKQLLKRIIDIPLKDWYNCPHLKNCISYDTMIKIFKDGKWPKMYGGRPWQYIAESLKELAKLFPVSLNSISLAVLYIDRINDIEHNTARMLYKYASFPLYKALNQKKICKPTYIFEHAGHMGDICKLVY